MYYYVVLALSNDHGTCILNGVDLQSMCDSSSHNILQTTKQVVVDRVSLYEENIHTVFEMEVFDTYSHKADGLHPAGLDRSLSDPGLNNNISLVILVRVIARRSA